MNDFLVIDYPHAQPFHCIHTLKETFDKLGIPLSEEKTLGPTHCLEFLGITLNSVKMQHPCLSIN